MKALRAQFISSNYEEVALIELRDKQQYTWNGMQLQTVLVCVDKRGRLHELGFNELEVLGEMPPGWKPDDLIENSR
jgi:hypothetical protein